MDPPSFPLAVLDFQLDQARAGYDFRILQLLVQYSPLSLQLVVGSYLRRLERAAMAYSTKKEKEYEK